MRLTKKAREDIGRALSMAERARAFIHSDRVAVCRRDTMATTTAHYKRADGASLVEINREAGSDLVLLDDAIARLAKFLLTH